MKILLVQTSFIGDNILSTPVLANLKKIYPNSHITVLSTPLAAVVYQGNPNVNTVLTYDKHGHQRGLIGLLSLATQLRSHQFDVCYCLHKSWRSALTLWVSRIPVRIGFKNAHARFLYTHLKSRPAHLHDVERNLMILDGELEKQNLITSLSLPLPAASEVSPTVQAVVATNPSYAVLVPGSVWKTKRWQAEGYHEVADYLLKQQRQVVILGSGAEQEIADQVAAGLSVTNLAGKTTLNEMFYLVANAGLVVCNDSMSLHVASAFKIPTVTIFCATSPSFGFGPWENPRAIVVEKQGLHCKPCRPHGSNRCPTGTEACMRELSAREVIQAIDTVLSRAGKSQALYV